MGEILCGVAGSNVTPEIAGSNLTPNTRNPVSALLVVFGERSYTSSHISLDSWNGRHAKHNIRAGRRGAKLENLEPHLGSSSRASRLRPIVDELFVVFLVARSRAPAVLVVVPLWEKFRACCSSKPRLPNAEVGPVPVRVVKPLTLQVEANLIVRFGLNSVPALLAFDLFSDIADCRCLDGDTGAVKR